jgi:hypothetical protein
LRRAVAILRALGSSGWGGPSGLTIGRRAIPAAARTRAWSALELAADEADGSIPQQRDHLLSACCARAGLAPTC